MGRKAATKPASPAHAAAARRNGRKGGRPPAPLPQDPAHGAPAKASGGLDELDALRRMLSRLDAATEALYGQRMRRQARDKELRANARVMAMLVPKARLRRAEKTVRGELDEIANPRKDPPMEPVTDEVEADDGGE